MDERVKPFFVSERGVSCVIYIYLVRMYNLRELFTISTSPRPIQFHSAGLLFIF